MSVFGDLADDLKLRAEDLGPQLTQKQVESLPMGVDYKPTYKANERPFLYPGETEEERIKDTKDTKKTFDDAMSRYVSMQVEASLASRTLLLTNCLRPWDIKNKAPFNTKPSLKSLEKTRL